MATATITLKKGTTAEWTESKRVLDDGELGLETTTSGHRIIRIGNGSTEFMSLPVAFDIEEVREIKTGMDKDAKTYYDDMVKKGTELLAEMKALATTVELEDDATQSLDDNAERRDVSVLWILHGCVRSEVVVCSI